MGHKILVAGNCNDGATCRPRSAQNICTKSVEYHKMVFRGSGSASAKHSGHLHDMVRSGSLIFQMAEHNADMDLHHSSLFSDLCCRDRYSDPDDKLGKCYQ